MYKSTGDEPKCFVGKLKRTFNLLRCDSPCTWIHVFLPSFVEIGKAEVTKPVRDYQKKHSFGPFSWSLERSRPISPKNLWSHFFPIPHPSAKFHPNPPSFPEDTPSHSKMQGCARGLFSRDRGETETKAFRARGRGVPTPRRDRAEALLRLETASRPRRQDRGHIPAEMSFRLITTLT